MTTKRTKMIGAVAGTAVAVAVPMFGAAASTPTTSSFTVWAHHVSDSSLDLGHTGISAGDQDLFLDRLTRGGHAVGQLVGSCTAVAVGQSGVDELCEFVLRFGSAQLTAAGTVHAGPQGPGTFTLPVVGGSGGYRGASGQIEVTATDSSTLPITVSLDR